MDGKLVGALLVTLIALVFTVSIKYYTCAQPDQANIPSPTSTPEPASISHSHFILIAGLALLVFFVVFAVRLAYS